MTYCKAMDKGTPQWYDVKYAYSGLHSIINPPPSNVNLFQQKPEKIDIKAMVQQKLQIYQKLETELQTTEPPDCNFCFVNYRKVKCQFYRPLQADFQVKVYRNGNVIVCECCDHSDNENECAASCSSDDIPLKALLENSNSFSNTETGMDASESATVGAIEEVVTEDPAPIKIQPGWYGKGWRRRKRKRAGTGC